MGPLALIGMIFAGGVAMIPFLGGSDEGNGDEALNDDISENPDAEGTVSTLEPKYYGEGDSDQNDDGIGGQQDNSQNYGVILNTLSDAEWDSDDDITLTAEEFKELTGSSNFPVTIKDGEQVDEINASETEHGLVYLSEGDTLTGSDVAEELFDFTAIAQGMVEIQGGDSDEVLIANGNGASVDGGKGNDLLISDSGASTLHGGDGDDTLLGNGSLLLEPSAGSTTGYLLDDAPDYLDGGAGDDYIAASNEDTVIGGAGADEIVVTGGNATIVDFDPDEDILNIALGSGAINVNPYTHESYNLDDRIELHRSNDELTIEVDGDHFMTITCDEATSVGYLNGGDLGETTYLTTHEIGDARPDILIYVELQYSS